ncbi:hypothetical protein [Bifidobacterium oedipodis]|uniref:Uncharacterized protein n=1 Tax=Bifidobacterium oedipodis TaxID=2675322 RepID=A0A7Y0EQD7_9BIFI|nr:hypothetical protein [Bifidobacterium sp. DSM 109957]NMM94521.1 hypothetical protein [Bifidobacterium sp. DSM 109957]
MMKDAEIIGDGVNSSSPAAKGVTIVGEDEDGHILITAPVIIDLSIFAFAKS